MSLILTFTPDSVVKFAQSRTNTKRFVVETFARLQPISHCSAISDALKVAFPQLWRDKIGWDDPLLVNVSNERAKWCSKLSLLCNVAVFR